MLSLINVVVICGLGGPFNFLQISYVVHMLAQVCDLDVGVVKYSFGDVHIYKDHIDGLLQQFSRTPYDHYPELILNKEIKDFNKFEVEDFAITEYKHQGKIVLPVSV